MTNPDPSANFIATFDKVMDDFERNSSTELGPDWKMGDDDED